jgi:hypothetical protein
MFDVDEIEAILQSAARAGHALSYSEILNLVGMRFTRPKMRAICKVFDEIDRRAAARGEPELAVLVVRESDRLPGQGWWVGRHDDYDGNWTGASALAYVREHQTAAFDYWQKSA